MAVTPPMELLVAFTVHCHDSRDADDLMKRKMQKATRRKQHSRLVGLPGLDPLLEHVVVVRATTTDRFFRRLESASVGAYPHRHHVFLYLVYSLGNVVSCFL
jgi:hypothetical protein